ncbi:MAG: sodium-dependent transporter [Clostridia bacterium]|nr:sodium-dependent transporter [Clostridia bacterium]MBQ4157749.1 sodium-dependent transporter [Clostridia bacterium]
MQNREHFSSRIGFLLISAGCAIGCGNVWKFPWMVGQNGGGIFVLIYLVFLLLLGLPVMIMEFSLGRATQSSPISMYQKLEKKGQKWHLHGPFMLLGNIALMSFYTCVSGWLLYYFIKFLTGSSANLGFSAMIANPSVNMIYMGIVVAIGYTVLSFKLQGGLERINKCIMIALLLLMVVLAGNSFSLEGAKEGISFYLKPDFSKISFSVVSAAMNQAFFTLSLGIGSMAIFGSYIGKERSLLGESINIILLDLFVALTAGCIIFPACYTYHVEVSNGPSLLFDTMAQVFNNMNGGRFWGSVFFLFMVFAAMSTVFAVFENILACFRELTGAGRVKGSIICAIVVFAFSTTTALGFSLIPFEPFAPESSFLNFWDFIVSTNLIPIGSLIIILFSTNSRFGWGWENLVREANSGKGLKVQPWMKPIFTYVVPILVLLVYITSLISFDWR